MIMKYHLRFVQHSQWNGIHMTHRVVWPWTDVTLCLQSSHSLVCRGQWARFTPSSSLVTMLQSDCIVENNCHITQLYINWLLSLTECWCNLNCRSLLQEKIRFWIMFILYSTSKLWYGKHHTLHAIILQLWNKL